MKLNNEAKELGALVSIPPMADMRIAAEKNTLVEYHKLRPVKPTHIFFTVLVIVGRNTTQNKPIPAVVQNSRQI
jgi:hypothetical protein